MMDNVIIAYLINVLLLVVFIIDRLFRLRSIKEFRDAKARWRNIYLRAINVTPARSKVFGPLF
jgi:hypothetical protein